MEINITLVIQAIHFYIAYIILDRLLLRPAVSTIQKEQQRYTTLITNINEQLQLLKDKELYRQNRWQQFRNELINRIPAIRRESKHIVIEQINGIRTINKDQQEQYKKELVASLIRRLSNVS